ncbi:hypothetical protein SISNIDRAFT_452120, partial [Sistotremastrum niveocremeum HHB9708]
IPPERRRGQAQSQPLSPTSPTQNTIPLNTNGPLRALGTRPMHIPQASTSTSTSLTPLIHDSPPSNSNSNIHASGTSTRTTSLEEGSISGTSNLRSDSGTTESPRSSTLVSPRASKSKSRSKSRESSLDTSLPSLPSLDIPSRPSLDTSLDTTGSGPSNEMNEVESDIAQLSNLYQLGNLDTIERDIYRARVETFNALLERVTGHNFDRTNRHGASSSWSSSSSSSSTRASSSRTSSRSSTAYSYTSRPPSRPPSRSSSISAEGIKISRPLAPDPSSAPPSLLTPPDFQSALVNPDSRVVQVVGRLVRRMSTIESFGSREGEGTGPGSSPVSSSSAKSTQSGTRRVAMVDTVPVLGADTDTDTDIDVVDVDEALQPDTQDSYGVGVGVGVGRDDASANLDCGEPRYAAVAAIAGAVEAVEAIAAVASTSSSSSVAPPLVLFDHATGRSLAISPAQPPLRPPPTQFQALVRSRSLPDLTPRVLAPSRSSSLSLTSRSSPARLTGISHRSTSLPELRTLHVTQALNLRNVNIDDRDGDLEASDSEDLSQAEEDEDMGLGESGDSTDDYGVLIESARRQD